jgi:hypothetical protein
MNMNEWWGVMTVFFIIFGIILGRFTKVKIAAPVFLLLGLSIYLFVQFYILPHIEYSDNRRPLFDFLAVEIGSFIGFFIGISLKKIFKQSVKHQ